MYYQEALEIAEQEFANRASIKAHPLRDTHINDVPVIAAELMARATREPRQEIERLRAEIQRLTTDRDHWKECAMNSLEYDLEQD